MKKWFKEIDNMRMFVNKSILKKNKKILGNVQKEKSRFTWYKILPPVIGQVTNEGCCSRNINTLIFHSQWSQSTSQS